MQTKDVLVRKIVVDRDDADAYVTYYQQFGWELKEVLYLNPKNHLSDLQLQLTFVKKHRKTNSASEKVLNHQLDSHISDLRDQRKQHKQQAAFYAYLIGLLGFILLIGSLFVWTFALNTLAVNLAFAAAIATLISYPIYKRVKRYTNLKKFPVLERRSRGRLIRFFAN